ncbi:hypothetical protein FDECE_2437 [Fusarium decemcellulare]|nr:hypothetical protein FDECE_2437 [Fusarium decemcellulare]
MTHSLLLGHLLVARQFYLDWAPDANLIQTFGYYMSKNWKKFFPGEKHCPPVVYVDMWPIANPMAFSMEAYVSNQIEIGHSLPKSPMQGQFLNPISNGKDLNCMHGEEWQTWRSRFNPGFSKTNIRAWAPAFLEEVESFVQVLSDLSGQDGKWGPVFQLEKISGNLAFDAAGRVILEQLERMEITLNIRKLLWRATPMFQMQVRRKRQELFEILQPFILKGLEGAEPNGPRTIIQSAIAECQDESRGASKYGSSADNNFVELVFYQLMIFFFGGDDAISIVIPWMFKHLQSNPECLHKLREEHATILGEDPDAAAEKIRETPHVLDLLQYTMAVIKESLRLNPATITIRQGQPDFTLKIDGSGCDWPTHGFDLFDSSITIHHDPRNFQKPLKFIPDRFLVPDGHHLHPQKNIWRGFQLGPRKCIGQEMAMVVLKIVLVLVVRKFDIEMAWEEWDQVQRKNGIKVSKTLVEGERMYTTGKATSHPKDGAPVHVRLRNSA